MRRFGAAAVVMAFDERGRPIRPSAKIAICTRAYRLLDRKDRVSARRHHLRSKHFAVATGIEEHADYAKAFFEATRRSPQTLPHAHVSGGVSTSFSFRGNEPVREAMHAVFFYHAIRAGMDMGIVNAGSLTLYDNVEPELRERGRRAAQPSRRCDRTAAGRRRTRKGGGKKKDAERDLSWRQSR